jgi:glyoxylase-like metal-dependent hydrolase (beta-lactamase superfamily II)
MKPIPLAIPAVSLLLLASCGGVPDAATAIRQATAALGAQDLKSVEFSGSGFDFVLGQNANPDLPWPRFNNESFTESIDFEGPALKMHRIRTQGMNPPRGGGLQPIPRQDQTRAVAPGSPGLADEIAMLTPYGFLRAAAAAPDAKVAVENNYTVITYTGGNKAPVSGYVNRDGVLERVSTTIDQAVFGDIPFVTEFTGYKDFSGLKFPTHIVQSQGGHPVLDWTVTDVKPNAPVEVTENAAPPAPPGVGMNLPSEKLADGVFLLPGRYTAIALDFGDHIVILEGGQSDERSSYVMAEAKKLIPGKPIRYVVNTHSHVDHAGGLRAYVAEGATVVTHEINVPMYQKVWKNPHTLNPDLLARNPKEPAFEPVGDKKVMTGNGKTVELYHQPGLPHHDGMLIAYLPALKLLLEADSFNPAATKLTAKVENPSPNTVNLLETIERLKLDVRRIISVHYPADSRTLTMAELRLAAGR